MDKSRLWIKKLENGQKLESLKNMVEAVKIKKESQIREPKNGSL